MKLLKHDSAGNITLVVNCNTYEEAPPDCVLLETDLDDLAIINDHYLKDGVLKKRSPRPTDNHLWNTDSESWILDLNNLKNSKSKYVDQACKTAIVSGFVSYALGKPYHYPSKVTDQQNLAVSVLASYDPDNAPDWTTPFWCSDAAGEWAFRPHTAAQIREVGRDAKTAIIAYQFKNEGLQADISAATTVEQLDAVNW